MTTPPPTIPRIQDPIINSLRSRIDIWLLLATITMLLIGLYTVYSASFDFGFLSGQSNNDPAYYLRRQTYFLFIGLACMASMLLFDYQQFRRLSIPLMGIILLLLIAVLVIGDETFGARRTLFGGSVQPSELAKLIFILYAAHWLSNKRSHIISITKGVFPFSIITGIIAALIVLEPHKSTAILILLISLILLFVGGMKLAHAFIFIIFGVIAFILIISASNYARSRINTWWDSIISPTIEDLSAQEERWKVAVAHGGLYGFGPARGQMKYTTSAAHTDGPFAVLAEEFGFLGSVFVLFIYVFWIQRATLVAIHARDTYGFLIATGITSWVALQSIINISVILGIVPTTGMPLPFISYGGSGLVPLMLATGILLSISRDRYLGKTLRQTEMVSTTRRETRESDSESTHLRGRDGGSYLPGTRRRGRIVITRDKTE